VYYIGAERDPGQRLKTAVVIATVLHAAFIFGVSFDVDDASDYAHQIEVTLAYKPSDNSPDEARHVAQSNQEGSGDEAVENQVTSAPAAPLSLPSETSEAPQPQRERDSSVVEDPALTTRSASARLLQQDTTPEERADTQLLGISPEVDQLTHELASLEAELDEQTRAYSSRDRVKRITSVAARESVDAAYLNDWRLRVEAVGNKYYPEASLRYGIYGSLRLLVVIRYDGTLEDIRVLSSSGHTVLDDAAVKIVRMAAPFAPFPAELRAEADKLEIIRTWQFQENTLSSG
jgi:protein TonB